MSSIISTTIRSTVGTVPSGYESVVDRVVEAVEGLAAQAADSIRESASAAGISGEQVEAALVSAGLVEEEAIPESDGDSTESRLAAVERKVDALVRAASERFGFTV